MREKNSALYRSLLYKVKNEGEGIRYGRMVVESQQNKIYIHHICVWKMEQKIYKNPTIMI